jgi:phosphatidylserine/phosphatidylglycerophosphate/cardiolipin synthase-like enzyme
MRATASGNGFDVRAIGGSHTVLLAIDATKEARKGLLGFAIKRTGAGRSSWLRGLKVFEDVVPKPKPGLSYSTLEHPIQSFLWGYYGAEPGNSYEFIIRPVYGKPGDLRYGNDITITVKTENEDEGKHAVFFNRGAIASQAFADKFGNQGPKNDTDPTDPVTAWLSRGLLEAALHFINDTRAGETLRVAAYEFSYPAILDTLKAAYDRGVDIIVVYEAGKETVKGKRQDTEATKANRKAIKVAGLPDDVLRKRTKRNAIPHNKFMVRLSDDPARVAVWTGSTNFTSSGFLGQTNVGHIVRDSALAQKYIAYWKQLADDAEWPDLRDWNEANDPNPAGATAKNSIVDVFSPRRNDSMLDWYAKRIGAAGGAVMFTAAFGVNEKLAPALAKKKPFLRFLLLEKPLSGKAKPLLAHNPDIVLANGAALGKKTIKAKIPGWKLDKWFLDEGHYRYEGFVFYIHTKVLLIDPLSDDPLVISGSANFSKNSLVNNDENMLIVRGNSRIADIYMTEFDRIFRHFYFRDIANTLALQKRPQKKVIFLDPTDGWVNENFGARRLKSKRRKMFFPQSSN